MIVYTGIGSRTAPEEVLHIIKEIGRILGSAGFTLRSGHAQGADMSFEAGHSEAGGRTEIFLPWKKFNGSDSSLFSMEKLPEAAEIAKKIHPGWNKMSHGAKMCIARNVFQVMGSDLRTLSSFIVGWSRGSGGTEFTFRLADSMGIPVIRLEELLPEIDSVKDMTKENTTAWQTAMTEEAKRLYGILELKSIEGLSPKDISIERHAAVNEFFWLLSDSLRHSSVMTGLEDTM